MERTKKANQKELKTNAYIQGKSISQNPFPAGYWIKPSDALPPINEEDEWDKKDQISKEVLTYSEFGLRWGVYFYQLKTWRVNGVIIGPKTPVLLWTDIIVPDGY